MNQLIKVKCVKFKKRDQDHFVKALCLDKYKLKRIFSILITFDMFINKRILRFMPKLGLVFILFEYFAPIPIYFLPIE